MSAVPPSRPGFDNDWRWNMLLSSVIWRGCSVEPWIISRRQRKQLKLWRVTRGGSGGKMSKAHARVRATLGQNSRILFDRTSSDQKPDDCCKIANEIGRAHV